MIAVLFFSLNALAQEIPVYKTPPVFVTPASFREAEPDSIVELPPHSTSKAATVDDVLRGAPGVVVSRSGGTGQPSSLFIRGAASEHTLVLLDGVEINDPSHPSGGFDFSTIDLNLVEKVEIFKGPQSLRYGSGAVGGVVNIVTKKGGDKKNIISARGGSHQTNQVTVSRLGSTYSVSATRFETAGISAAARQPELDGHRFIAAAGKISRAYSDETEFEFITRAVGSESDLDYATSNTGPNFLAADDPNYNVKSLSWVNALKAETKWTERWKSNFSLSHFYLNRTYNNPADAANAATFHDDRFANSTKFENINSFAQGPRTTYSFGPSVRIEKAKHSAWLAGIFGDVNLSRGPFLFGAGGRLDQHQKFGGEFTYSVAPGVRLWRDSTLAGRVATGFKAPSLFQIYDPTFGNPNLKPERVQGEELSFEQQLTEEISAKLTAFQYEYSDLIQFTSKYNNIGAAKTRGAELEYAQKIAVLDFQAAYTYTDARNSQTGARLVRRPFNSWRLSAGWQLSDFLTLRGEYRGVGSRPDIDALSFSPVTTGSYEVADVSAAITFSKDLQATASVENLFDRRYQEVAGYGTPGLGVYFGVRAGL